MEFKQEALLNPYIERNTELQKETEKLGKKIKHKNAKLTHNAIIGKWIENPMHKVDVKIITTKKIIIKTVI